MVSKRVRSEAGARRYDLPIGAPIAASNDPKDQGRPNWAEREKSPSDTKVLPNSYINSNDDPDSPSTGMMIALVPTSESAQALSQSGGDPVEDLHLTLYYANYGVELGEASRDIIRAQVAAVVASHGYMREVSAQVIGCGVLGGQNAKVFLVGDSYFIPEFRDSLIRVLNHVDMMGDWSPYQGQRSPFIAHITAGYDSAVSIDALTYRGEVKFDRVRVAIGSTYTDFPIEPEKTPVDKAKYNHLPLKNVSNGLVGDIDWQAYNTDTAELAVPANGYKSLLREIASSPEGSEEPPKHDTAEELLMKSLVLSVSDSAVAIEAAEVMYGIKAGPPGASTPSKNPGATKLREYWTKGKGAAKIRWGTPNDWYRCRSHLRKYVGTRADGLCQIYHRAATGTWAGQHGKKDDGGVLAQIWVQNGAVAELKTIVMRDTIPAMTSIEGATK